MGNAVHVCPGRPPVVVHSLKVRCLPPPTPHPTPRHSPFPTRYLHESPAHFRRAYTIFLCLKICIFCRVIAFSAQTSPDLYSIIHALSHTTSISVSDSDLPYISLRASFGNTPQKTMKSLNTHHSLLK